MRVLSFSPYFPLRVVSSQTTVMTPTFFSLVFKGGAVCKNRLQPTSVCHVSHDCNREHSAASPTYLKHTMTSEKWLVATAFYTGGRFGSHDKLGCRSEERNSSLKLQQREKVGGIVSFTHFSALIRKGRGIIKMMSHRMMYACQWSVYAGLPLGMFFLL